MNQHAIDALDEALRQTESDMDECDGLLRWQADEIASSINAALDRTHDADHRRRIYHDIEDRASEIRRLVGVHADHAARRDGLRTALAALREAR